MTPKKPSKYVPLLGESARRLPTFCAARGTSMSASGYHQQQFSSSCPQHEQRQRDTRRRRAGGHPYRHQCCAPWRTATIVPRASSAARLVTEARVIPRPDLFSPSKSSGTGLNSSSEIREFDGLNQRGSRESPVIAFDNSDVGYAGAQDPDEGVRSSNTRDTISCLPAVL